MQKIELFLNNFSAVMWGPLMLALLFGTHLFLTFRLRFIQRYIFKGIRLSFSAAWCAAGEISPFGSLATALAATVGTGNIIGVATAVSLGGPGAVLWMWLTGVFGIATKYAEALLSVKYRRKESDGSFSGGPMYVLERGLGSRPLGVLFAIFTAVAAFGIGNMVQANSISAMLKESYHVPPLASGIALAVLTALVVFGGIKAIANVCMRLVPMMIILYVLSCLFIIALGWRNLPASVALIVTSAFNGQAALGGFLGAGIRETMRFGIARGLFSNESGLGSAPIIAAAARTETPVQQALVSATGTFWDTVVVCAMTGIMIVNSGAWSKGLQGASLIREVFSAIPVVGPLLLAVSLFTFVFSTILGWSYYGKKALEYLFKGKHDTAYMSVWVAAVVVGATVSIPAVWAFADIANACMAIPNLISLILLSGVLVSETSKNLWRPITENAQSEGIRVVVTGQEND